MTVQNRFGASMLAWVSGALLLLLPTIGLAAPLTYTFSGTVVTSADPAVAVGESYLGLLQYDPQASLVQIGGNFKKYIAPAQLTQLTFAGASMAFTGGFMQVTDPAPIASFGMYASNSVATTGTAADYFIVNLLFTAPAGTFSPNFDVPADITAFTPANGLLRDSSFVSLVTFTVGNVTLVPEPGTLSLLALGGLVLVRRRG